MLKKLWELPESNNINTDVLAIFPYSLIVWVDDPDKAWKEIFGDIGSACGFFIRLFIHFLHHKLVIIPNQFYI